MESDGQEVLERAYREHEREVPDRVARMLRWLRDPNSRRIRIPLGVLLILSSALWFLPVLGIKFLAKDVYYITDLPSEVQTADVVITAVVAFLLTLLATLYPSWRASRVQPAEALRYE